MERLLKCIPHLTRHHDVLGALGAELAVIFVAGRRQRGQVWREVCCHPKWEYDMHPAQAKILRGRGLSMAKTGFVLKTSSPRS